MEVKNPEDLVFSSTETDTHLILTCNLKGYQVLNIRMLISGEPIQIADRREKAIRLWGAGISGGPGRIWRYQIQKFFLDSRWGCFGSSQDRGHRTTWPVPDKVPETKKRRKNVQEMEQGNKDVPQHEPEEASGVTMTHPEEEPTHQLNQRDLPSTQETPAKEDADLEAKTRAAGGCEQGPEAAELTKVEADQATQRAQVEEYNAQAQLKPKQENDLAEPLKPDHPEEKVDNRKGSLAPPKKCRPCSLCLFAGSAILVSIVALVIHFRRPKRK
ncbi:hypothetical protein CK203_095645 [Vitis vinifera]|uniref:Uncharacterized protein n=1 Tax=Vitis vinifera TaxID=29760 RepID=A0A438EMJ8_VITVI|nr:hypothetical protein CK203_095645 [Vitis vinifera]